MPQDATLQVGIEEGRIYRQISDEIRRVELQGFTPKIDTRGLGQITGAMGQFNRSLEAANARVIAFGASTGVVYGVITAIKEMTRASIEVEKAVAEINVNLNLSTGSLAKFSNELFKVANNTGTSFSQIAKSAAELARQGLTVAETLLRTRDAAILSRLANMDNVESLESLTAAINSFNKSALDSTEIVNKFARVDASFAVSSRDLAEAVKRVGSSAQDAGVSLDELIGLVTSAQQTTSRGGAVIGNALKTIFARVGKDDTIDQLRQLGVEISNTQNGMEKLKSVASFVQNNQGSGAVSQVKQALGGVYQYNVISATLNDLSKQYGITARATEQANTATDEAIQKNEQLNQTLAASLNTLKNNLTQVGASMGGKLLNPIINSFISGANDMLSRVADETDSKDVGAKIGRGILEGLGSFISGPGAAIATVGLFKLLANFGTDIAMAAKSVLGLNRQAQVRLEIEGLVTQALNSQPEIYQRIRSGQMGVLDLQNMILASMRETVAMQNLAASSSGAIANAMASEGLAIVNNKQTGLRQLTGSNGALPKFANPISDAVSHEMAQAKVSSSMVRIGSDARLISSHNPGGLGVYNVKDEPAGLGQGISRAMMEGRNPKTYGIPGFALGAQGINVNPSFPSIQIPQTFQTPGIVAATYGVEQALVESGGKITKTFEEARKVLEQKAHEAGMLEFLPLAKEIGRFQEAVKFNVVTQLHPESRTGLTGRQYPRERAISAEEAGVIAGKAIQNTFPGQNFSFSRGSGAGASGYPLGAPEGIQANLSQIIRREALNNPTVIRNLSSQSDSVLENRINGLFNQQVARQDTINQIRIRSVLRGGSESSNGMPLIGTSQSPALQALYDMGSVNGYRGIQTPVTGPSMWERIKTKMGGSQNLLLAGSIAAPILGNVGRELAGNETTNQRGIGALSAGVGTTISSAALGGVVTGGPWGAVIGGLLGAAASAKDVFSSFTDILPDLRKEMEKTKESLNRSSDAFSRFNTYNEQLNNDDLTPKARRKITSLRAQALDETGFSTSLAQALSSGGNAGLQDRWTELSSMQQNQLSTESINAGLTILKQNKDNLFSRQKIGESQYSDFSEKTDVYGNVLSEKGKAFVTSQIVNPALSLVGSGGQNLRDYLVDNPQAASLLNGRFGGNFDTTLSKIASSAGIRDFQTVFGGMDDLSKGVLRNKVSPSAIEEERRIRKEDEEGRKKIIASKSTTSEDIYKFLTEKQTKFGNLNFIENKKVLEHTFDSNLETFSTQKTLAYQSKFISPQEAAEASLAAKKSEIARNLNVEIEKIDHQSNEAIRKEILQVSGSWLQESVAKNYASPFTPQKTVGAILSSSRVAQSLGGIEDERTLKEKLDSLKTQRTTIAQGLSEQAVGGESRGQREIDLKKLSEVIEKGESIVQTSFQHREEAGQKANFEIKQAKIDTQAIVAAANRDKILNFSGGIPGALGGMGAFQTQLMQSMAGGNLKAQGLLGYADSLQQNGQKLAGTPLLEDLANELANGLKDQYEKLGIPLSGGDANTISKLNLSARYQTGDTGTSPEELSRLATLQSQASNELRNPSLGRILRIGQPTDSEQNFQLQTEFRNLFSQISAISVGGSKSPNTNTFIDAANKSMDDFNKHLISLSTAMAQAKTATERLALEEARKNGTIFAGDNEKQTMSVLLSELQYGKGGKKGFGGSDVLNSMGEAFRSTTTYGVKDMYKDMIEGAQEVGDTMKSSFKSGFMSFVEGSKSAKNAAKDFAMSIGQSLLGKAVDIGSGYMFDGLTNITSAIFGGHAAGGEIKGYSVGGKVFGGSGARDDVPALLSKGEYVIKKSSVQKYGDGFLNKLNNGGIAHFAGGGFSSTMVNREVYDDPNYPKSGYEDIDPNLSNYALSDPNSTQNTLRESRVSQLSQYLKGRYDYDRQVSAAMQSYKVGLNDKIIGAGASILLGAAGQGLTSMASSIAINNTYQQGLSSTLDSYSMQAYGDSYNNLSGVQQQEMLAEVGHNWSPSTPPSWAVKAQQNNIWNWGRKATGGFIGFSNGGVNGVGQDTVPSLLTGGEFVVRKPIVDKYGLGMMNQINQGTYQHFAGGGAVGQVSNMNMGDSDLWSKLSGAIEKLTDVLTKSLPKNATMPNAQPNQVPVAGAPASITSTVNVYIQGNGQTTTNSDSKSNNSSQMDAAKGKQFAELMKNVALQTITEQQRSGGLLAGTGAR